MFSVLSTVLVANVNTDVTKLQISNIEISAAKNASDVESFFKTNIAFMDSLNGSLVNGGMLNNRSAVKTLIRSYVNKVNKNVADLYIA